MKIAVIDGQGGGIGKHITEKLRKELSDNIELIALGTNAMATTQMLKAGANEGASGEAAIIYNADKVDLITGPISIMVPHSMLGELTPAMATAIAQSKAPKFLLPVYKGNFQIIGLQPEPLPHLVDQLVANIKKIATDEQG